MVQSQKTWDLLMLIEALWLWGQSFSRPSSSLLQEAVTLHFKKYFFCLLALKASGNVWGEGLDYINWGGHICCSLASFPGWNPGCVSGERWIMFLCFLVVDSTWPNCFKILWPWLPHHDALYFWTMTLSKLFLFYKVTLETECPDLNPG